MTCGIPPSARLEQKPGASLGLVDPHLDQARGGDVAMLLADVMDLAKTGRERLVVFPRFGKQSVRPPTLRMRSAIGSVIAKS
jgi:hypothetical protein